MSRPRVWLGGMALVVLLAGLWVGQRALQGAADEQTMQAPRFEVDPFWPKPLPNNWRIGSAVGVAADDEDNIWIVHRSSATLGNNERAAELDPPDGECCVGAPFVLAFDPEGNLVHAWGGPGEGYDWPDSMHGVFVDHMGNVWLGGGHHILKFTKEGKFVAQYGRPDARDGPPGPDGQPTTVANSHDLENFGRVAKVFVDPVANEAYIADGYVNRRVAVLDASTGKMKRYWGAYGNKPDDNYVFGPQGMDDQSPPQQFRTPVHCANPSRDGLVYVCDRAGDRVQVFRTDGTFVKEMYYAPKTLRSGSSWDLALSSDPEQRYLYVADGVNEKVRIVDRETLRELTNFGAGGRQPGQFYGVHSIATDSRGNVYTTETYEGKRVQKFVYMGMGSIPSRNQGVLWPEQ